MAALESDTGALRLRLDFVDRERTERGSEPAGGEGGAPEGRLLARAAVEYLDRRDGEHWPVVQLPPLHVTAERARALVDGAADLLRGASPGFAWRSGEDPVLAVQLGAPQADPSGPLLAEVGLDLSPFLAEVAGAPRRPAAELALIRFPVARAAAVAFASALRDEVDGLLGKATATG